MKAVILAGGKGTRLHPYTTNFPKALMPIGDKPILEVVIEQLKNSGINNIIITVGHLEELIRVFFKDGKKYGVDIEYSIEDKPLGTAGPLNLIKNKLNEGFLMMNADVLSDIDYNKFIDYHEKNKGIGTIALAKREVNIDFGVVELDEKRRISDWKEKPTINYLVSMGVYAFKKKALDYLPEGKIDLPDFLRIMLNQGEVINGYIHDGYWLDIGRPKDYELACREFNNKK